MGLLIRIQKRLENKLMHKQGEHGKPVYYADPEEVDETTTRTSNSASRPASRLTNLSFLASRRNSTQRQATDTPPRSPSFFCRGSSAQPNARRSLQPQHARNGSNLSATEADSGSGSWRTRRADSATRNDSDCTFRVPALSDSGYVSRDSDPDIGFLPGSNEPLASPSQMGNSMTLVPSTSDRQSRSPVSGLSNIAERRLIEDPNGHVKREDLRARASSLTLGGPGPQAVAEDGSPLSPGGLAEVYEAPSAMSSGTFDETAGAGLRGFEGDRDGFFGIPFAQARPNQPSRSQTTATNGATAAASGSNNARVQIAEARRNRRPYTTTRALTGY